MRIRTNSGVFYYPDIFLNWNQCFAPQILGFGSLDFPICVDYVQNEEFGQKYDPERGGYFRAPDRNEILCGTPPLRPALKKSLG